MTRRPAQQFFDLDDVRRLISKWSVDCGTRVMNARVALGWDRQRLAEIVGTTEATIHRIEAGKINPRDHMKLAIAAGLQKEVADLWPYPPRKSVYEQAAVA